MKIGKTAQSYALGAFASVLYSFWMIFSYKAVAAGNTGFIQVLLFFYFFGTFISVVVGLAVRRTLSVGKKTLKYSLLQAAAYAPASLMLFYELGNAPSFTLTASAASASIIVFALLVSRANGTRPKAGYFAATLVVFLGMLLQAVATYGLNFSSELVYLAVLVPMAVFYGLAGYVTFRAMRSGVEPFAFFTWTPPFQLAMVGLFLFLTGNLISIANPAPAMLLFSFLGIASALIGWVADLYAFRISKHAKAGVLNTINILTSLELVGIAAFSFAVLDLRNLSLIGGLALTLTGIVWLNLESR